MATAKAQQKKFDPARPHGTVYGHLSGKFEQDGILYNGSGDPVDPDQIAAEEALLANENKVAEQARARELASK